MITQGQESVYTTPKKQEANTTVKNSADFLGSGDIFRSKNYSSMNLNSILESDFKFKSPNKLLSIKISESPWISNQKRNKYMNAFFEASPRKCSNYKLRFCDTIKQESRVTSCFNNTSRRINNAFELEKDSETSLEVKKAPMIKVGYSLSEKVDHLIHDDDESCSKDGVRKRRRKTSHQLRILKEEFTKNSNWTKDQITHIANTTGLSESQVYKWCWDQKKKVEEESKDSRMDDVRKKAIFCDSIPLYKNLVDKINEKENGHWDRDQVRLGKRRPFGAVNDCRVRDNVIKKIKI